jgi:hypothetical protein
MILEAMSIFSRDSDQLVFELGSILPFSSGISAVCSVRNEHLIVLVRSAADKREFASYIYISGLLSQQDRLCRSRFVSEFNDPLFHISFTLLVLLGRILRNDVKSQPYSRIPGYTCEFFKSI